jgi:hypothetical protein
VTEQERFYGRANAAVDAVFLFAIGFAIGRMLRAMTPRQRLMTLAIVGCAAGWLFTHHYNDVTYNEEPTVWSNLFLYSGVVLFIVLCKDVIAVSKLRRAQQAQLEQEWAAQQVPAPVPAPVAQRVTRTVTVTRAPVRNDDAQQRSQSTTGTSPRRPEPRPVRSIEQHGNLRITDRRPFDPELGE